jgi:hypothetical protein
VRFPGLAVDFELICSTRFFPGTVPDSRLPRGVTVAQVTLDHFVMVRIHARQLLDYQVLMRKSNPLGAPSGDTVELISGLQRGNRFVMLNRKNLAPERDFERAANPGLIR